MHMSIEDAAEILDHLASDLDPIYYRGMETSPRDLGMSEHCGRSASRIRIEFYSIHTRHRRRVKGSMRDMILDRMGLRATQRSRYRAARP